MKPLLVVVLMMFSSPALMATTTHLKFTQDGEFVSISESTGPSSGFSLNVARGTVNGVTTANINYESTSVSVDFSSITFCRDYRGRFLPPISPVKPLRTWL